MSVHSTKTLQGHILCSARYFGVEKMCHFIVQLSRMFCFINFILPAFPPVFPCSSKMSFSSTASGLQTELWLKGVLYRGRDYVGLCPWWKKPSCWRKAVCANQLYFSPFRVWMFNFQSLTSFCKIKHLNLLCHQSHVLSLFSSDN